MSAKPSSQPRFFPKGLPGWGWAALVLTLAAWAAMLWLRDTSTAGRLKGLAAGSLAKFEVFNSPQPLPVTPFADRGGDPVTLGAFRGKTVLVNFWATWCKPCRAEMPSLARLEAALGGEAFGVVTVSLDLEGYEIIDPFLAEIGVANLPVYWDRSNRLTVELATKGLPMTILIDREGRWVGRLDGPAEWDTPEALALMKAAAGL
ncbi:MAG TPA: TlpA disulfide reductase family protein [Sphingomonadales bacterium]|nr:TlpA disulfide reductase family protein [Sphingomonadales bacterium]